MLSFSKKNDAYNVIYSSANFQVGTVITLDVLNESNVAILGSPFTMTGIGTTGMYEASFTPSSNGTYKFMVTESGNKTSASTLEVMDYNIDQIGTIVQGISVAGLSSGGIIP